MISDTTEGLQRGAGDGGWRGFPRRLFDAMAQGVLVEDARGVIAEANAAFGRMVGLDHTAMKGRRARELGWMLLRQDGTPWLEEESLTQVALRSRAPISGVTGALYNVHDGRHRWVQMEAVVLEGACEEGGEVALLFTDQTVPQREAGRAALRDWEERRRAEDALRRSEERLRAVVTNVPVVLFALDDEGVFTLSEGRGLATLGLRPGQVVGESALERYRDVPEVVAGIRRALAGEATVATVAVESWFFQTWFGPLRSVGGRVTGVIGVAFDITEQRRVEGQLRRLSQAVEQSPASVVITNPEGVIEYVNPKFEAASGYTRDEVVGKTPRLLKSGQMAVEVYRELWRRIRAGQDWRGEFHNRRRDGGLYWESAVISPIKDDQGRITHYVAVKEDITERKQAEALRGRLEAQLREAQKLEAFGQLAGGIAHDFNNLLTVIQSHACLLRDDVLVPDERPASIEEIVRAAERAAHLTGQLLAFSRRQLLQRRPLDLNHVVAHLTRMLPRLLGERIALQTQYAAGGAPVQADPGMMEQLILNLATNARDAMPGGGRMELSAEVVTVTEDHAAGRHGARPGAFVRLTVGDTGAGISPEHLPRIFEPFFTTKDVGKGTGLGLSMVFGIVEQHGGWIEVDSAPGRGTTLRVYLPRLDLAAAAAVPVAGGSPVRRGSETILVVDDEEPLRLLVRTILERSGYRVLEATNGPEALALWEAHPAAIQLLLTDLVMPEGMSGLELARQLRARAPALRVVYTSGYSDEALKPGVIESGARFLPKPYDPATLTRTLRDALDAAPPATGP